MVSPGQTLRYEGRETTASGSLSFHRACASTKRLRQNVKLHHFFLFRRKYKELKHSTKQQQRERQKKKIIGVILKTNLFPRSLFFGFGKSALGTRLKQNNNFARAFACVYNHVLLGIIKKI